MITREQLEAFDPSPLQSGVELRSLCPICGEGKQRDNAHRSLTVSPFGYWHCFRCDSSGSFAQHGGRVRPMDVVPQRVPRKRLLG